MEITIKENNLTAEEFIGLSKIVGWGISRQYDMTKVEQSLKDTTFTWKAILGEEVVGCVRVYSDDLLMTFIPDIFVDPKTQGKGIGSLLLEKVKEKYGHTTIFFGAQPGNEKFFEKAGFEKSVQSYAGKFNPNPYYK